MFEVGAMLAKSCPICVALELAKYACFGHRIVGPALQQRGDPTFQHGHAVACDQEKPVRDPRFAERVGVTPNHPGQAAQRLRSTEDRRQELVFRRFFPETAGLLPFGEIQCAPVSCITSLGNDGRSAGSKSAPHPGIELRSSSVLRAIRRFSRV